MAEMAGPAPPMARVEEHTVEQGDGSFSLRVLVPNDTPPGV